MANLWQTNNDSIWKINAFDRAYWLKACEMFAGEGASDNPLEDADDYLSNKIGGGRLIKDTFHLLYKRSNEKRGSIPANLQTTERIIDMAQNMDELDALKSETVGNKLESAMAARDLATRLAKKLPRDLKQDARNVQQAQEKLDAATEALDEILDIMDAAELPESGEDTDQKISDANTLIDKLESELETALADMEETASASQGALGVAVKDALEESDEQLEQVLTFVKAFTEAAGGDVSGGIDLDALKWAKKAMADCPMLNDFAELLGWGSRVTRGLWRDSLKGKADPAGIKATAYDPQTTLQTEQTALQGGYGKAMLVDARMRLSEEKILNYYKENGEEESGLGDCFYLTDVSGSMSNKEVQTALGLLWGLVEIFRKDDRELTAIQFAGHSQYEVWEMPGKNDGPDLAGLYRALTRNFSGGTEVFQPLTYCLDKILETGQDADIVIFTDGMIDEPPQEFLDKLEQVKLETSVKVFAINSYGGSNTELEKFSDVVLDVKSFYDDKAKIVELLRGVV